MSFSNLIKCVYLYFPTRLINHDETLNDSGIIIEASTFVVVLYNYFYENSTNRHEKDRSVLAISVPYRLVCACAVR